MNESVRVANNICRQCGHRLDGATGIETRFPSAGDLSICVNCGALAVFNDRGELLPPSADEMSWINQNPKVMAMLKKARHLIYSNKRQNRG